MAEPFSAPSFFNMDFDSYVKGQMLMAWNALPTKYRLLHDGELYYLAALGMLILVICCFSKGHRTTYSRTYCCCLRRDTSTVVERLDGSTYLFLCANPFHNPLLWTVGVLSSTLQLILLIIVVVRVDANYQAVYACSSMRFQQTFPKDINLTVGMHTAMSISTDGFAWPGIEQMHDSAYDTSKCRNIGEFGEPDADPQTEEAVLDWSDSYKEEIPSFLRVPFLQFVSSTNAAFLLIFCWIGGDAVNAIWCLTRGHVLMFLFTITNVAIAMVVALLQVLTWTTPFKAGAFAIVAQEWNLNNPGRPCGEHDLRLIKTRTGDILGDDQRQLEDVVPGISPIDVIVNSVAIMLILDLDEKVFNMTKGMFYESYHSLRDYLEQHRRKYHKLVDMAAPEP